jgi:beta-galactosidase
MHGARGFNLYMAVERDRWYGAPVGVDGSRRPHAFDATRRLVQTFKEVGFHGLERRAEVALLHVREYGRLGLCTSLLDPLPPMALSVIGLGEEEVCSDETFGLEGAVQHEVARVWRRAEEALAHLHLTHDIVDSGASAQTLQRYRLLLVPSFDFMDRALLSRLSAFVEEGGRLLLAPRRPGLDETMGALLGEVPPHVLSAEDDLEETLRQIASELGLAGVDAAVHPEVDVVLYREGRAPRVVFVANRTRESRTTRLPDLETPGAEAWDALSGVPVNLKEPIHLAPYEVRMVQIARPEGGRPC